MGTFEESPPYPQTFLSLKVCANPAIVLPHFFKSGRSTRSGAGTGWEALYSPFLFDSFFFVAISPKKKRLNGFAK